MAPIFLMPLDLITFRRGCCSVTAGNGVNHIIVARAQGARGHGPPDASGGDLQAVDKGRTAEKSEPVARKIRSRADVFTVRAGALLRGTFGSAGTRWQPYLKGNVWWGSNGFDTVSFNSFGIPTGRNGGATLDGGGGVIRQTDPQRQRLRRCQLSELAEWRVARRPKGQCRPARDVVRLAADPNAPARSDANIA